MTLYTALDVSLRSVAICVVDERGTVRHEAKAEVEVEVDRIVGCLRSFSSELMIVGFEAGTLTQYLTYGLQAAGFEVICLETRRALWGKQTSFQRALINSGSFRSSCSSWRRARSL